MEQFSDQFPLVFERARSILQESPACHDWDHTLRVLANARRLVARSDADVAVVSYGTLLHDIGRPAELADSGKTCHAQLGASMVRELLPAVGVDSPAFIDHVAACVGSHRFRRRHGDGPATLEARVVFDADKLDSIGAVGIGRAFHFAGRIGARLHNTEHEAIRSPSYSREDSAYREYLVKLRHVRDRMLTEAGRQLAEQRHQFMVAFFDRMCAEVDGHDLLVPCDVTE